MIKTQDADSPKVCITPPYVEVLEFCVLKGFRFIIPSELDLALAERRIKDYEKTLKRHEEEPLPPEIKKYQAELDEKGQEATLALERVIFWEETRIRERRTIQASLENCKEMKAQLLEYADAETLPKEATIEREYYLMQPYRHGARLEIEDELAPIDPIKGTRPMVNQNRINERLLGLSLIAFSREELPPNAAHPGWEMVTPEDLPEKQGMVLTDRMAVRAQMPVELAPYFRTSRNSNRA